MAKANDRYTEADRIREERYAEIMEQNAYLRGEVRIQESRLGNLQATCAALEHLHPDFHDEYIRRKQLEREGFTVSAPATC